MAVLIDSTIWIKWLRSRIDPRPLLKPWLLNGTCLSCGIIRVEVLRGVTDRRQKVAIERLFDTLLEIPLDGSCFRRAESLAWELDRKGKVLPLGDILIAQCALDSNAWLVTDDKHFSQIKMVKVRSSLPEDLR